MYEKSCFVLLTNQCNLRCTHCYNVLDPNKSSITEEENSLSIQKLSDLFTELIKNGFTKVLFSGGEALLRKDIFTILKEAKKKGLNTALFTNGHMLSEDVVDKLGEAGLKEIRISFNELVWIKNRKQYEKIFSNQTKYLSMLKNADISVGYVYIVSGYNIDYTYETYLNLQKLGASMKIQPLYIPKNFEKYDEVSASAIPLEKWEKLKLLFSNDNLNNTEIEEYPSSVYGANEEIINYIDFLIDVYCKKNIPNSCPTGPILVVDSSGAFHPCLFRYDVICGNISNKEDIINVNDILKNYKNLEKAECYREECLSAFR